LFRTGEYYYTGRHYEQAAYCYRQYLIEYPGGAAEQVVKNRITAVNEYLTPAASAPAGQNPIFQKNQFVFAEGEQGSVLYVILSGSVKITKIIAGKEIILAILKKGDMFGEMAILESKPRSASAIACEDCSLAAVKIENFESVAGSQPAIVEKLTETLAGRLWFIDKQFANTLFEDPVGRIFDGLAMHIEKAGVSLTDPSGYELPCGFDELAKMVGLSTEERTLTLAKVLKDMNVRSEPGKIIIKDVREVAKQRQFYLRMQKRKSKIEDQKHKK
jgi:CRP-like cAMP-binding protein